MPDQAPQLDPLDPRRLFASWEKVFHLTLFGMGPSVAAVVVDEDLMAYVLYRRDHSYLGDIRENRETVVKERLAWPVEYIEAARAAGTETAKRFLYFAAWRARNAELIAGKNGSFAGWLQAESARAREMIPWFKEYRVENIKDIPGIGIEEIER